MRTDVAVMATAGLDDNANLTALPEPLLDADAGRGKAAAYRDDEIGHAYLHGDRTVAWKSALKRAA